jgi:hypothetical protein
MSGGKLRSPSVWRRFPPIRRDPNVANIYRRNVVRFTEALGGPDDGRRDAQALRSLIGEIVPPPKARRRGPCRAERRVHGYL